jgi:hypothetical protein
MRLFLDTSVLLAASGSANGASRKIFRLATPKQWTLVTTPYAVEEVRRNLSNFPASAGADWDPLRRGLLMMDDVFTVDRPAVFLRPRIAPFCLVPLLGRMCC